MIMEEIGNRLSDLHFSRFKEMAAVFVATLLIMKLILMLKKKRYNLPPGPWGLPVVGYLPFFGSQPHVTFNEMRKTYGDVISIRMGSWPAIVIGGTDVIKEALVTKRDDFAGRPNFTTAKLQGTDTGFAFFTYDSMWKTHHRIVTNVLYTYTNARKNPVESIIRSNAIAVIEEFLSHGSESFCPIELLNFSAFSMIYQLCCAGEKYATEDTDLIPFLKNTRGFEKFNRSGNTVNAIPWLRHLMPGKISQFLELIRESKQFCIKKAKEHELSFDINNLRDITDGLIHAGNRLTETEKALKINKTQLIGNLSAIIGAASGTVSSTLSWCVALMAAFPEVQEEIFQQIDRVVGQGRDITLADRAQLPLVEATITELFRYISIAPFSLPHSTTCDTTLQGYDIPEGTVVMVNLHSIFMDEKLWGDPKVFRPHRFLDREGQLDRGLVEQVPAFSLGRRRCVGEFLARIELFLFTGTLLQRVRFFKPPGESEFELKAHFGLSLDVEPFNVCVRQRE